MYKEQISNLINIRYQIPANDIRGARLHQILFGYRERCKAKNCRSKICFNKWHWHDGILRKFIKETGEKLTPNGISKQKQGDYIVPVQFETQLKQIFTKLNLDHYITRYKFEENYRNCLIRKPFK